MQLFDAKVDKDLFREWTDSLVFRHKKTTAELTERVSDVLDGVSPPVRHRQERSNVEEVS